MLNSPFQYETRVTPTEYQKLGELSLRWSHLDHIIGNCLAAMLKLSAEEAVVMVFSLNAKARLKRLNDLAKIKKLNKDAQDALDALNDVMEHISKVRNNIVHAILIKDEKDGAVFHLRSGKRTITKEQAFSIEELTNYAAHAAFALRYAIGGKGEKEMRHTLPDKPDVPDFVNNPPPTGIRVDRPLSPRPPSSPE